MSNSKEIIQENKRGLRTEMVTLVFTLLITIAVFAVATFAWYVYYTQSHTTKVRMQAGSTAYLEIAKEYDGDYSPVIDLEAFKGTLQPVSTDKIILSNGNVGFQRVKGFIEEDDKKFANLFESAEASDYFNTTMYIRTKGSSQGVYIAGFMYEDSTDAKLMSSAMRVGIVVHEPGKDQPIAAEYIFEMNGDYHNPSAQYNTDKERQKGDAGIPMVLDSSKTDGTVLDFTKQLRTKLNFVDYDEGTGKVTKKAGSLQLFKVVGKDVKTPGESVQVDVYLWLEGCDPDCAGDLGSMSLKNFAVRFASVSE